LLLPGVEQFNPEVTAIPSYEAQDDTTPIEEVTRTVNRPPSATAPSPSRVIAANIASVVAIPTSTERVDVSEDFGSDDSLNEGWGNFGGESSEALGNFGSITKVSGTIEGYLYDFKQTPKGKPVEDYSTHQRSSDFADRIKRLHSRRFSESSLRRHYRAKTPLYLQYISIPISSAQDGPRFFQAEEEVKPSGWIAHYRGKVVAPKNGTFRFAGTADDYISVMLDDKFKLTAAWGSMQEQIRVKDSNAEEDDIPGDKRGPLGREPLVYGSWFTVRKGQEIDIALTVGERPGGRAGFVLLIQEQGVEYRKNGEQNILPPFTMGALTEDDITKFKEFPGWEIETENVPVFKAK